MIKVSVVKDWKYPKISRQSPNGEGKWGDVQFIDGFDSNADYLIVFNAPNRNMFGNFVKGGKWILSQESPIPYYDWHKESYQYFDKIFGFWREDEVPGIIHAQTSLPWHIDLNYDELKSLSRGALNKTKNVSWITSSATSKPGHKLRITFKDYLEGIGFDFDLYGRGFTPINNKFDALRDYRYSLAIENYQVNDYWTEKFADCVLSWSMPIYYGCKNILKYFPEKSMLMIDPDNPELAVRKINEAIEGNLWENSLDYIEEARELILDKYQLFPNIASRIMSHHRPGIERVSASIPANAYYKQKGKVSFSRFLKKIFGKI
ncbi:glycosyltransferase family 10 domain-containing protein [Marinoscillum sp. MHG1-6]|uniref:glycosyltransferase family 10 domain-containing protein n=1 Tax=Marinoscillum sp. MHG1-6 TaxID=2959627 RepID=UPI0021586217|nr:glycosyltransferase family 10 [Marinoscillum sp. MHG1-6]